MNLPDNTRPFLHADRITPPPKRTATMKVGYDETTTRRSDNNGRRTSHRRPVSERFRLANTAETRRFYGKNANTTGRRRRKIISLVIVTTVVCLYFDDDGTRTPFFFYYYYKRIVGVGENKIVTQNRYR